MPTNPTNARILLKQGKAKVIQRTPFTIQLLYETTEYVQPVYCRHR
ncbi:MULTISPECIES: RRXRR domain-containing protein [unclassified Desulfobacter]|nr:MULTISPECIES: RRXRR domain-containing protein [unclassified Desulfobacter]